jgi:hypothetical protein
MIIIGRPSFIIILANGSELPTYYIQRESRQAAGP